MPREKYQPDGRILALTQQVYILPTVASRSVPSILFDQVHRFTSEHSYAALAHPGIGILLSEAKAQNWEMNIGALNKPQDREMALRLLQKGDIDLLFLSSLDIGLDLAGDIIRSCQDRDRRKIVVGGKGATAAVKRFGIEFFSGASVVLGRGEGLTANIINDSRRGELQPIYERGQPIDLKLCREEPYMDPETTYVNIPYFRDAPIITIEFSDGCPYGCMMCPDGVTPITTYKTIADLEYEIDMRKLKPGLFGDRLLIGDNNLLAIAKDGRSGIPKDYLFELFHMLKRKGIYWIGQGTIMDVFDDEELMKAWSESNCLSFLVGLESMTQPIKGAGVKAELVRRLPEVLEKLRKVYKIPILFSLLSCTDDETPEDFLETARLIKKYKLDVVLHIVQPRMGSQLYQDVSKSGRWLEKNSSHRDSFELVHKPAKMEWREALAWFLWIKNKTTSVEWLYERYIINKAYGGDMYALPLLALEISSGFLAARRFNYLYPGLKPLVNICEKEWEKRGYDKNIDN